MKKNLVGKFKKLNKNLFKSDFFKLEKCDVLFYASDDDYGLSLNGKAYSPLIDSVFEELEKKGFKCLSVSAPWSRIDQSEKFNKSYLLNRNFLFSKVLNYFLNALKLKEINPYRKIFNKTKPKFLIGIGLTPEICFAAKEENILDIELLHGIGYTFIPWGWSSRTREMLPSLILALDSVSERTFKNLESKGVAVKKIVHPFLKRFINSKEKIPSEWVYDKLIDASKKNILISLTWGYAGDHGNMDCFSNILPNGLFYDDLELIIAKRNDIVWHFRLHPVQMRSDVRNKHQSFLSNLANRYKNVIWLESSLVPLPSIARLCDGNITMSSMSCYDVASVGLKSLVLCPTTRGDGIYKNYFEDLVDEGYVIKNKFDLKFVQNWIDQVSRTLPRLVDLEDDGDFETVLSTIFEK